MQTAEANSPPEAQPSAASGLTLEEVLRIIRTSDRKGFPGVSSFLKDVYQALKTPNTSTQHISNLILRDVALTSSILKLVNSSLYAHGNGERHRVSTISRAIMLLGVDTVGNLAAVLNVFETFRGCAEIKTLKKMTIHSLLTGSNARELSGGQAFLLPEQAFIYGVMNNLGPMLVAYYLPERYQLIEDLALSRQISAEKAGRELYGISLCEVGLAVSREWHLPEELTNAIGGSEGGEPSSAEAQKVRAIVSCAEDLSSIAVVADPEQRKTLLENLAKRYSEFVDVSTAKLSQVVSSSHDRIGFLTRTLNISRKELEEHAPALAPAQATSTSMRAVNAGTSVMTRALGAGVSGLSHAVAGGGSSSMIGAVGAPDGSGAHRSPEDMLLASLDEIVSAINKEMPLNDVLMMILETVFRGLSFDHVLLALITPDRTLLRGRLCVGARSQEMIEAFQVRLTFPRNSLAEVISRGTEINVAEKTGMDLVPKDFLTRTCAKSFILLPLVVKNAAIGAIYAQRSNNGDVIGESELRNVCILRNYAAMAIKQCK